MLLLVRFFRTNHSQHVFNPKACQLSVSLVDKKVTSHFSCLFVMKWISVTQYLTVNCHITVPNQQSKLTFRLTSPVALPLKVSTISGTKWLKSDTYTGCPRRNVRDFGRVFFMLNYTDITHNTYVQSRTFTEIMAREKCGHHRCRNTVRRPWHHTCPMRLPDQRDIGMQWPWRVRYSTVALMSQDNRSAAACVKYLEV